MAKKLADTVGAQVHSASNDEVISHPGVTAVIVSTSEGEHVAPILKAIQLGKHVLVEKPLALTLADADGLLQAIEKSGADVRVGYSRRYKDRYLIGRRKGRLRREN